MNILKHYDKLLIEHRHNLRSGFGKSIAINIALGSIGLIINDHYHFLMIGYYMFLGLYLAPAIILSPLSLMNDTLETKQKLSLIDIIKDGFSGVLLGFILNLLYTGPITIQFYNNVLFKPTLNTIKVNRLLDYPLIKRKKLKLINKE